MRKLKEYIIENYQAIFFIIFALIITVAAFQPAKVIDNEESQIEEYYDEEYSEDAKLRSLKYLSIHEDISHSYVTVNEERIFCEIVINNLTAKKLKESESYYIEMVANMHNDIYDIWLSDGLIKDVFISVIDYKNTESVLFIYNDGVIFNINSNSKEGTEKYWVDMFKKIKGRKPKDSKELENFVNEYINN